MNKIFSTESRIILVSCFFYPRLIALLKNYKEIEINKFQGIRKAVV